MKIQQTAAAGTMESSDIMVTVLPSPDGIQIDLTSSVEQYYGDSIRETIRKTLEALGVSSAKIEAVDHGALDCTIQARLTTAVRRAAREEGAK